MNKEYQINLDIKKIKVTLLSGNISLNEVYIEDHKKDTLIYARTLNTTILSLGNALNGKWKFGDMDIEALVFNMKTHRGDQDTNLNIFLEKVTSNSPKVSAAPFFLSISHATIKEGEFRHTDQNDKDSRKLNFIHLNAQIHSFTISGSHVNSTVDHLDFVWDDRLVVKKIATEFSYTPNGMQFGGLIIQTPKSFISGHLLLEYERNDLQHFMDKVKVSADITEGNIAFDEINLFYDRFGKGKKAAFSGQFLGTLNNLQASNVQIISENTAIDGGFWFYNLFRDNPFQIKARISRLSSTYHQLHALLPGFLRNKLPSYLEKLGSFTINGTTLITRNTVEASLSIMTAIGNSYSDLSLKNIDDKNTITYEGVLTLEDFQVGELINSKKLGKVSLNFNVEGKGFTRETLNTEVIGEIAKITYNNYTYRDLEVSGIIKDELFDGILITHDDNFKLDFKGLVDFSQQVNTFNFKATVDHANLSALNFVSRDNISVFKGELRMNMQGTSLDDISGTIGFSKTNYINQNDNYYFEDFNITSTFREGERVLEIDSPDIITGYVKGKFYVKDLNDLIRNAIGSAYTNYSPYVISPGQHIEFNLNIYNKIVEVFYPGIDFGKNTYIRGNMTADNGEFKLVFKSPHINIFDVVIDDINLQVDTKNPLFNTYIEVGAVQNDTYAISNFNLINTKLKDTLFFRTEFKGGAEAADTYNLNFYHTFNQDKKSVIGIKTSELQFKGNQWYLNKEDNTRNKVIFNSTIDTITIQDIVMNHKNEQINLTGTLIDSVHKDIKLQFKDVALDKITPSIANFSLKGQVNGVLNILQDNDNYLPSSNLVIHDFKVNDNSIGVLDISITGSDNLTKYDVDINIINKDIERFSMEGIIAVINKAPVVRLETSLQHLNAMIFNPLGGEVISDIRGDISGDVLISGPLKNPEINGILTLEKAGLKIPYLNVDLEFDDATPVHLHDQTFEFKNLTPSDTQYRTETLFNGTITHTNFENWYLDLNLDTQGKKFLVLNTTENEEALYYGTGFMDGTAHIYGYTDQLNIRVNAATEEGTSLKIPINEVATIGDTSFINFIDKNANDTILNAQEQYLEYKGLDLQFDLDVTPDAEVAIVIDKKSGSTLKGTGAGNLLIEINTNGKFRMWGDFITYTGTYIFKYGGIIDKKFNVLPGGTINWEGDPFNAAVNMKAVYALYANPALLLDDSNFTRKVATEVEIQLQGNLEQIAPDFNIRFPGMNSVTNSELQYRLEEKDKRQLQALSLLSQGAFISEVSVTQQAFTGNLIQTASGLVNEILNDSDGKFDVGLSYEQGGRNPNSDLQIEDRFGVTISTQISDRILVNGKIGVPVGGVTETVVAGDVEVRILLNEDGSLSAKIFNKQNEIQQFLVDRQGYTQGIGLSYQVEFNTFQDLFRHIFRTSGKKTQKPL